MERYRNIFHLVLTLMIGLVSLSACSPKSSDESGEVLTIREVTQIHNLITPGVWDGQTSSFNASIYDFVVELDPTNGNILMPGLATEWSSDDGRVWTLKLREGVTFHDGSAFTSEDLRFTVERTQDPDIGHLQKQDFSIVADIETPDDYTIIFRLSDIRPMFMYLFTAYNMCVLSSEYDYANLGETAPMGTGPFMVKEFVPKESAHLVKNPDYWLEGMPRADEWIYYFVGDIDSSVAMLEAGQADIVPYISAIHKERLEKQGFVVVSPWQEYRMVALAADREPFDDNRVRLAMKYTMDPDTLARACQGILGEDVFFNEVPILNFQPQYKDIPFRGRNIDKARELLTEAGYPDGLSVEVYYGSDHPYTQAIAQTMKELAAPAGIDIQLKGFSRDVYLTQYWMNAPMLITGWAPRVDPSMLLMLAFKSDGPWNESHMKNAEVDDLLASILVEMDDEKRQQYYDRIQEVFYEEGTLINVQVPYYVAMRKEIKDYRQAFSMMTQYEYLTLEK